MTLILTLWCSNSEASCKSIEYINFKIKAILEFFGLLKRKLHSSFCFILVCSDYQLTWYCR